MVPASIGSSGKISKMLWPIRSVRLVMVASRKASLTETIFRSAAITRKRPGSDSNSPCNTARLRRSSSSAARRAVISRIALETSTPSSVSSGLRLISTGNSVPSLRSACSSIPAPIDRALGSAKKPVRCPGWLSRSRSGTNISMPWPSSSSRAYPNSFSSCVLTKTILPASFTTTTASGADSSSPRNFASARFRSVMSRAMVDAAVTCPREFLMGEMDSATSISLPSFLRRTVSSLTPSPWRSFDMICAISSGRSVGRRMEIGWPIASSAE